MTRYNVRLSVCVVAAGLLLAGCNRYERKEFENFSPSIQASRFKTIATVAASDGRTDLRLMVQAREDLRKAGWNAVRASGLAPTAAAVALPRKRLRESGCSQSSICRAYRC